MIAVYISSQMPAKPLRSSSTSIGLKAGAATGFFRDVMLCRFRKVDDKIAPVIHTQEVAGEDRRGAIHLLDDGRTGKRLPGRQV